MTTLLAASILSAAELRSPSCLPTLVLVPAAFCSPAIFTPLLPHLGPYPVLPAKPLPSIQLSSLSIDAKSDINFIRDQLVVLLDAGKQVVLVAHSHGALLAMAAARDLSRIHRKRVGKPGGVCGIILVAGLIAPEGESFLTAGVREIPSWYREDPETRIAMAPPVDYFLAEAPRSAHELVRSTICESSSLGFHAPGPPPAWSQDEFKGRIAYVKCLRNGLCTEEMQERMLATSESLGARWIKKDCTVGSHFPWLKDPGAVAQIIKGMIKVFERGTANGNGT